VWLLPNGHDARILRRRFRIPPSVGGQEGLYMVVDVQT
jgi:hypothetical protein